jgi:hypothetical protein
MSDNYKITVNKIIPGMGLEHIFDTDHFCDIEKAEMIYDKFVQIFPPDEYDVVLSKWSQNITMEKRSRNEDSMP